jgi:predicted nucleotidyltransferase
MHTRVNELIRGINELANTHEFSSNAFCIVYGSYPDGVADSESDLDVFVANDKYSLNLFNDLQKTVIGVHKKFNIPLDEEVSYRNKLLVTFKELEKATWLNGMDIVDNRFIVPDLIKTESYLESEQIKLRLLFNALTKPHYVLWKNDYYLSMKKRVSENLFWLAVDLLDTKKTTLDEIVDILFVDKNHRHGEKYLGYESYVKITKKIKTNVLNEAIRLNKEGVIDYDGATKEINISNAGRLKELKNRFIGSNKQAISTTL